jgi:hypothetical protein
MHRSIFAVDVFSERYEGLRFIPGPLSAKPESTLDVSTQQPPTWLPAEHTVVNRRTGERLKEADLFYFSPDELALSDAARVVLCDLLAGNGAITPVACPDFDAVVVKVVQRDDLLDPNGCVVEEGGRIERFAFRPDAVTDIHLFTLGIKQLTPYFVDQEFVDRCTDHLLAGATFWRVWTTDPSLNVVTDLVSAFFPEEVEEC